MRFQKPLVYKICHIIKQLETQTMQNNYAHTMHDYLNNQEVYCVLDDLHMVTGSLDMFFNILPI